MKSTSPKKQKHDDELHRLQTRVAELEQLQKETEPQFNMEEALRQSEELYRSLFENMLNGFAYCKMMFNGETPQDFIYLNVNRAFETMTGLKDVIGKRVSEIIPGIRESDPELFKTYGRVAQTGLPEVFETYLEALKMWFSISVYSPERGFFVAVFDVITERKLTEEKLRDDEARLHLALDAAKGGVWEWNLLTNENIWSDELWKVYGLDPNCCEPTYEVWLQTIHPDDRESAARSVQKAAQESSELNAEWRVRDRDGRERWLMSRGQPIFNATGQAIRYIGTVLDITERKQTEQALRQSENTMRAWLDAIQESALLLDCEGLILAANATVAHRLHSTVEELVGTIIYDSIPQENAPIRQAHVTQVIESGQPVRFEDERSGHVIDNLIYPVTDPSGRVTQLAILGTDISKRKKAEQALRKSEQLYRAIGESIDYGVWICEPDGRNTYASESFLKLVGMTQEQCSNFGWGDVLHPEDAEHTLAAWKECVRTGENWDIEHRFHGVDGQWHSILARGVPIRNEQGQIVAWAGINLDISKQKQSEEALQTALARFQRIFDANVIGIVTAKANGDVLEANDYYLGMLGYTRAELKSGKVRWTDITPPEYLYLDQIALRELAERGTCTPYEKQYIRRDGSRMWVLIADTLLPGEEGEIVGFILDISAQKSLEASLSHQRDELRVTNEHLAHEFIELTRAEEEIQQLNEDLEKRVRERTAQLESANKELEAFAYSVSHDLRAPLRGIDGWSHALLEEYQDVLDEQGNLYLQRVRSETRRMSQLIDDLLQLSRVTHAEMQIGPVDISAIAQTIITRLQTAQPERLVDVVIQPGLTAYGDAALLTIVLTNLLDNAWKFTGKGLLPRIEFGQTAVNGLQTYYVRDNGAGFDMAYAQKLFGAFQRLHHTSEFPGTGIGLATVQRIILRHGGRVWVEAEVNQGATFFFTLGETNPV